VGGHRKAELLEGDEWKKRFGTSAAVGPAVRSRGFPAAEV